ncbi:MAG: CDP-diacylglycerol--glycerol-3-phosphate 3-phosphatidyltransferase [Coriobacteriia bacterium]|nr:CDP-diacylglycerol--glycerol-3-phosphate 3-phosphatidyltransferase [Coriobacteriia bacterium]
MRLQLNWATRVTLIRMILIPVFLATLLGEWPDFISRPAWWAAAQPWLAAAVFTLLASTDGIDGYLARSRNEVTTFGKFLDPLADKLLVTAALVALVDLDKLPSWIVLVIVSREFVVSGLRMVAVAEGKVIAASPWGKVKTVLQIAAIVAFIVKDSTLLEVLGSWGPPVVRATAWGLMTSALALTLWSMLDYFYHARDVITGPWTPEGRASVGALDHRTAAAGALRTAAVLTVGTELTEGLRPDTNAAEVAAALARAGHLVRETVSVPDRAAAVAGAVERLLAAYDTVVVTGGLGPTHDDVTREGVALALGVDLAEGPGLRDGLARAAARPVSARAAEQVYRQAFVLPGAEVLPAATGTAPGQVVERDGSVLALLPGPPAEMRPMLAALVRRFSAMRAEPVVLPCAGMAESDAQVIAEEALDGAAGVGLSVLARPGEVDVVLIDEGAGPEALAASALRVRGALGEACYAAEGATLPEAVLALASRLGIALAVAESCTGGSVAAEITSVPGSSAVFLGGVVAYADETKERLLGVPAATLAAKGAVSAETAVAMAEGARRALSADVAVSVTGIAGPGGGTPEKPVGTVWVCVAGPEGSSVEHHVLGGDRDGVRRRATVVALDLLRRRLAGTPGDVPAGPSRS